VQMNVVNISSTSDFKTFSSIVLDVLFWSTVPSYLILIDTSVGSDGGGNSNSESMVYLVANAEVSLIEGSDCLSPRIEGKPLSVVIWVMPVQSQSELVGTNMLMVKYSLSGAQF